MDQRAPLSKTYVQHSKKTARNFNNFQNTDSILTVPYTAYTKNVGENTCKIVRDSTFLDATLQVITVANASLRFHRITKQSCFQITSELAVPRTKCPTTIVPFASNGGQENVVKFERIYTDFS